jgi:hypothetical protein
LDSALKNQRDDRFGRLVVGWRERWKADQQAQHHGHVQQCRHNQPNSQAARDARCSTTYAISVVEKLLQHEPVTR